MKLPMGWLRDYVDVDATPEDLADRLTFSGVEVEGIETIGASCEGVVVGEIMSVAPHPGADRLRLCRVNVGDRELPVVCGADNMVVGDKAPLATVGCTLPSGMKVKAATLRGERSEGMLCAEDELGISDDHTGIMILPADSVPGTPFSEILGPPETVLELEITWNRPDCLSIVGMAREVAALYGTALRLPAADVEETGEPVEQLARVTVEDAEGCPRYTARVLTDVTLQPSPFWMQRRLLASGVRPISNIVDVTNYVMLECGQPLHAFDYDLLNEHHIIVRRARQGETMATLDGQERPITPEMLMITDPLRPVAVAGVMGGAGSEIGVETRRVLLESAYFHPPGIARTSTALGLATESSHRFERGIDIDSVEWASRRAARLMAELGNGKVARGVLDVYPSPAPKRHVRCRFSRTRSVLGVKIDDGEITSIFEKLQLPVVEREADACTLGIPAFRTDIEREADLIEEVARMHGLDAVPAQTPSARIVPDADDRRTRAVLACRSHLVGLGLYETLHYSFLSPQLLDLFENSDRDLRVVLPNPVSAEYSVLRHTLLPHMVESLGRNLAHQTADAALFEMGKVFLRSGDGGIAEEDRLSVGLMGAVGRRGPDGKRPVEPEEMFLWLKGIVEELLAAHKVQDVAFSPCDDRRMVGGTATAVAAGAEYLGVMGLLGRELAQRWRMPGPVGIAELRVDPILVHLLDPPRAGSVPAYPSVSRDVALVADQEVTHEAIEQTIRRSAPPELTAVRLFDIFSTAEMGGTKRSLAYSLVYRSPQRTLTDEEANGFHEAIKDALKKELNVEIREG